MEIAWRWNRLSPTESQVAEFLLEGRSNKEICGEMVLSRTRVQECIRRIVTKTGAESTRSAIILLVEERGTAALLRVLEQANVGVAVIQDGVCKYVNKTLMRMTGYRPDEMVGMSFPELLAPQARGECGEKHERRMRSENPPVRYRTTIACKRGRRKDVRVASVGFLRFNGGPAVMAIVFQKE